MGVIPAVVANLDPAFIIIFRLADSCFLGLLSTFASFEEKTCLSHCIPLIVSSVLERRLHWTGHLSFLIPSSLPHLFHPTKLRNICLITS